MKDIELKIIRCFLNSFMWPSINGPCLLAFSSYWEFAKRESHLKRLTLQGNFVFCQYNDLFNSIGCLKERLKAFDNLP
jgi:hypothetical protein